MPESGTAQRVGEAARVAAPSAAPTRPAVHANIHANIDAALGSLLGHAPGVWAQTAPPAGGRTVDAFAVLPSTRDPRLLIPAGSRRAAAASLQQHNNATSRSLWLKTEAMAWAMRLGAGGRIARGRLHVLADETYQAGLPLKELLEEIFGPGRLELSVRLGPMRPNRKPVIQILRPSGTVLGYAKVSRTELTARLVANEGAVLSRIAEAAPRTFRVPTVFHNGTWAGMQVLIVGPLPRRHLVLRGTDARIPVVATKELSELFGSTVQPLVSSPHWQSTRKRVADIGGPAGAALMAAAATIEERHGDREIPVGMWHGDWTPSNMSGAGDRLSVWDWERSSPGMPTGMDAGHFGFHIARKVRNLTPVPAAAWALDWLGPVLGKLGLEPGAAGLVLALALLEMAVRFQEARAEGVEVTDPAYLGALQDLLARQG